MASVFANPPLAEFRAKVRSPKDLAEALLILQVSSRTFAAIGTIRLCEQHFQECLRADAGGGGSGDGGREERKDSGAPTAQTVR